MTSPIRRVFISYAREDLAWAEEQFRTLRSAGIEVFLDLLSNRAGDDFPARIRREIADADQVRVGWSRYAAQSRWVRQEYMQALDVARESGRPSFLLIYLHDETSLPAELAHIHAERSAFFQADADRLLRDPHRRLPPGSAQPSLLLRSEYQVVPFHGREEILARTEAWCLSGKPFDLVLYVGPGGSGKTRLFAEICARMRKQGWDAGFLDSERAREALDAAPERLDKLLHPRLPTLAVVDYAESRHDVVQAILRRAADRRDGQPVRLVLLARSPGDWWRELLHASADFEPLIAAGAEPIEIPPLTPTLEERRAAFEAALIAFSNVIGVGIRTGAAVDLTPPQFDQPLSLQLRALLGVLGEREGDPAELLTRLLAHEERYWKGVAKDVGLDLALERTLAPSVALVTLVDGVAAGDELHRLLSRSPLLADRGNLERRQVGEVLTRLYGWGERVEALQPDRVGEALVAREISRDGALLHAWHVDGSPEQLRQGLTVLGRVATQREDARGWLVDVLAADTKRMAETAMEVAVEGGEPVGRALAEAFELKPDSELARELESRLPAYTLALRELKVVVTRQALIDVEDDAERARLLNSLGNRLGDLGHREEALAATREAVQIRHRLAEARPDACLPDLAASLNNLGIRLSDLGHREEALRVTREAVEIRRRLAESHPDAFLPDLAGSLNNLGENLSDLGRREEALAATREAVQIYRRLAEVRPDVFLSDLAGSLNNLGIKLSNMEHREEALVATREAVQIHRRLAEARPDAFLPDLAMSLNSLGIRLSKIGRREEALTATREAVQIRRRLVEIRPDVFLPDLATSLNNLAIDLSDMEHREAALAVAQEATDTYRRLAKTRPDAYLPALATSLNNLGIRLSDVGYWEDAVATGQEVVESYRRLAEAHPEAFLPDLAMSLYNLGIRLSNMERWEGALATTQEAVQIRRHLADAYPGVFRHKLVSSLRLLGIISSEMGRQEEALAAAREADEIEAILRE